ncbi:hypothetical protein FB451DRAFT_1181885 [Mycena latifolia]|nr:hypothetical protein FB451DRAFT_1181885 [Mycena latifolia]
MQQRVVKGELPTVYILGVIGHKPSQMQAQATQARPSQIQTPLSGTSHLAKPLGEVCISEGGGQGGRKGQYEEDGGTDREMNTSFGKMDEGKEGRKTHLIPTATAAPLPRASIPATARRSARTRTTASQPFPLPNPSRAPTPASEPNSASPPCPCPNAIPSPRSSLSPSSARSQSPPPAPNGQIVRLREGHAAVQEVIDLWILDSDVREARSTASLGISGSAPLALILCSFPSYMSHNSTNAFYQWLETYVLRKKLTKFMFQNEFRSKATKHSEHIGTQIISGPRICKIYHVSHILQGLCVPPAGQRWSDYDRRGLKGGHWHVAERVGEIRTGRRCGQTGRKRDCGADAVTRRWYGECRWRQGGVHVADTRTRCGANHGQTQHAKMQHDETGSRNISERIIKHSPSFKPFPCCTDILHKSIDCHWEYQESTYLSRFFSRWPVGITRGSRREDVPTSHDVPWKSGHRTAGKYFGFNLRGESVDPEKAALEQITEMQSRLRPLCCIAATNKCSHELMEQQEGSVERSGLRKFAEGAQQAVCRSAWPYQWGIKRSRQTKGVKADERKNNAEKTCHRFTPAYEAKISLLTLQLMSEPKARRKISRFGLFFIAPKEYLLARSASVRFG